jgi:thioester reductase-like protein
MEIVPPSYSDTLSDTPYATHWRSLSAIRKSTMSRILITGFPGFLATGLLPRLLRDRPDQDVVCLIERRMRNAAESRLSGLGAEFEDAKSRVTLMEGDITLPRMGWGDAEFAKVTDVTEVFHFAAAYDLDLTAEAGQRINVRGTRHVLDLCGELPGLLRLHYVSTCYVSGRFPGVFLEEDLESGRDHNNHYESTKQQAEMEVRKRMAGGLPATIYRPAAVVGDSDTGATEKFDGPYFLIRFLLRQPRWAIMPTVGDVRQSRVNVVPRDYLVDAMAWISKQPDSIGKTFQLADPDPPTNAWLLDEMARGCGRAVLRVRLPARVARWALRALPPMRYWLGIPPGAVGYFTHPTRYDVSNTYQALQGSGITCPHMSQYLVNLIEFARSVPRRENPPGAIPRS